MKTELIKKNDIYKVFNEIALKNEIVVFGSTYAAGFPFYEFTNKCPISNAIYNRSIEGLKIAEAAELVENCVISAHPSKVFLALGELDENSQGTISAYEKLIAKIQKELPQAMVYVLSVPDAGNDLNESLITMCENMKICYISIDYTKSLASIYKQLSLFFRKGQIEFCDAFSVASI